jgi:hypothetical protein
MAFHIAKHVARSLWLLLQMVVVMHVGMTLYHLPLHTVLADTSYAALLHHHPRLYYRTTVLSMVIPMVALMRLYHKSSWRACAEMTAVMVAPLVVLRLLVLGEVVPLETFLEIDDPLMIIAMATYLLYKQSSHRPGRQSAVPSA